jgi:hypothetical protein
MELQHTLSDVSTITLGFTFLSDNEEKVDDSSKDDPTMLFPSQAPVTLAR